MTRKIEIKTPKLAVFGTQRKPDENAKHSVKPRQKLPKKRVTSSVKTQPSATIERLIPDDIGPVKSMAELLNEARDIVTGKLPMGSKTKLNENIGHLTTSEVSVESEKIEVDHEETKATFSPSDDESGDDDILKTSKLETPSKLLPAKSTRKLRTDDRKLGKMHYFYCSPDLSRAYARAETPLLQVGKHRIDTEMKSRLQLDNNQENEQLLEKRFNQAILGGSHQGVLKLKAAEYTDPREYTSCDSNIQLDLSTLVRSKSLTDLSKSSSSLLTRSSSLPAIDIESSESLFENLKRQEQVFSSGSSTRPAQFNTQEIELLKNNATQMSLQNGLRAFTSMLTSDCIDSARKIINELKKHYDDHEVITYNMGLLAMKEKDYGNGYSIAAGLLAKQPENWRYLRLQSECLYGLKQHHEALEAARKSFFHYPSASAAYLQSQILVSMGKPEDALECLTLANEMGPTDEIIEALADVLMLNGEWDEAIGKYSGLLECNQNVQIRQKRGKCYYMVKDYETAFIDFMFVHLATPNNETSLYIGKLLLRSDIRSAYQFLRDVKIYRGPRAKELAVLRKTAHYVNFGKGAVFKSSQVPVGLHLHLMKTSTDPLVAHTHAKSVLKAMPDSQMAKYYLARQLIRLGHSGDIVGDCEQGSSELKSAIQAANLQSASHLDYGAAINLVRDAEDQTFVANSLIHLNEYDEAKQTIKNMKLSPKSLRFYRVSLMKAEISMKTGQLDTAKIILRSVRDIEDKVANNDEIKQLKAQYFYLCGELFYASELLQDALENYRSSYKISKTQKALLKIGIILSERSSIKPSKTLKSLTTREAYREQVYFFLRKELNSKAIETCNKMMQKYGADSLSLMLRGIAKCYIKATNLGRIDLERALQIADKTNKPLIMYNLALVSQYQTNGHIDQATQLVNPNTVLHVSLLQTKALVSIQRENWPTAVAALTELCEIKDLSSSSLSAFRHSYAIAMHHVKSDELTIEACNRLFDLVEDDRQAQFSRGVMYLRHGRHEKAEECFQAVISVLPLANLNLALLELQRDSIAKSFSYVNEFLVSSAGLYSQNLLDIGNCFLAQLYLLKGNVIHVEKQLNAVSTQELFGSVQLIRGLLALPNRMDAFSHFDKGARQSVGGDGYCAYAAAACLIRSRQFFEARGYLRNALPISSRQNALAILDIIENELVAGEQQLIAAKMEKSSLALINLCLLYKKQHKFKESFNEITAAIAHNQHDQYARYLRYYLSSDAECSTYKTLDLRYIINYDPP